MRPYPVIALTAVFLWLTSCGPSDEDLTDAINEHMVRLGMAEGHDYHAIKVQLLDVGDDNNGEVSVLAVVSGGVTPSGIEEGIVVPSPFSDTLRLLIFKTEGRWEVEGPTSK